MKKLLVILGAGSSIARGLPSVAARDELLRRWGRAWASHRFPNYYEALASEIDTYYRTGPTGPRPPLNFEKVLGDMVALAHWMTPAPWGDTLRQVACAGAPPPHLQFPNVSLSDYTPYGATILLKDQLQHLLIQLARHMRGLCQKLDMTNEAAISYKSLFDGLRSRFDIGIYNLNYDTAALSAFPGAYTGFRDDGTFDPKAIHHREEWGFVYHLHGSVHHSLVNEFGDAICWRNFGEKFFDGHQGLADDKLSDGRSFPKTTLVAGGFKLDQLLVEPFHSLHAALVRHIYAADAILIGGYGFADVHINRALHNRLGIPGAKVPVMVLDYADAKTAPMAYRFDAWTHELCRALAASGSFFQKLGPSSAYMPWELAKAGEFEVSKPHRVAIWYGGFNVAATRLDEIVSWLDGQVADG